MTGRGCVSECQGKSHSELPTVIPNGVRNLRSPSDGLPITTTVFRVRRHLRDSLNKSPWMQRMDLKPVPAEGRGSLKSLHTTTGT